MRTFEIAAVLTAVLALYLLALAAIESVPSLQRRVDDKNVMFALMLLLVLSFSALPFAHAAWRRREGPARGEAAPLAPAAEGAGPGYGSAAAADASAGGSFAPHAAAAGARASGAATELARLSALPDDAGAAADGPEAAPAAYGSSDDEGAEVAAAAAADVAAGVDAVRDVEDDVFGAAKYYAGGSTTVRDAFRTADYWLTVGIMFLNNAVAYSLLNNLGQLCHSLGAGGATAGLTALASCANCLGRILGGQASERTLYGFSLAEFYSSVRARNARAARLARTLLPRGSQAARAAAMARMATSAAAATAAATAAGGGVPRSAWLLTNAAVEAAGCLIVALATGPIGLFCGVPLVAASCGAQNTLLGSVFHERFGHKNFGALVGIAGLCLLPASLLFSTLLASGLYDRAARAQLVAAHALAANATSAAPPPPPQAAGLYCQGPSCFRTFFLIMAGIAAAQCVVAALHWRRMGRFYTRLAAKRANEKNA